MTSVNFNRANLLIFLAFGEQVTASQYTADNDISIETLSLNNYLWLPKWLPKKQSLESSNLVLGTGFSRLFMRFSNRKHTGLLTHTIIAEVPLRYRANKQKLPFLF